MTDRKGKTIPGEARQIIYNVISFFENEKKHGDNTIPVNCVYKRAAAATGVSIRCLRNIKQEGELAESKNKKIKTPGKHHREKVFYLDVVQQPLLRNIINTIYTAENSIPTLLKIHDRAIKEINFKGAKETLRRIMIEQLGYKYCKLSNAPKKTPILEKPLSIDARANYLARLRHNSLGVLKRPVVYVGETYIRIDQPKTGRFDRIYVVHAGDECGFISGAQLVFRFKWKSGEMKENITTKIFLRWLKMNLIPNLPPNSIVVMRSAAYNMTDINQQPKKSCTEAQLQEWLRVRNIPFKDDMSKMKLRKLCQKHRPPKQFAADQFLQSAGHEVLRLPPYNNDLNLMEYIWMLVKHRMSTFIAENLEGKTEPFIMRSMLDILPVEWSGQVDRLRMLEQYYVDMDPLVAVHTAQYKETEPSLAADSCGTADKSAKMEHESDDCEDMDSDSDIELIDSRNDIWSDTDATAEASVSPDLRLPKAVTPSFYRLKLVPKLQDSTFSGEVYITLKTNKSNINKIILHSKDLNIHEGVKVTEQVYENIQTIKNARIKRQASELSTTAPIANETQSQTTTETPAITEAPKANETADTTNHTTVEANKMNEVTNENGSESETTKLSYAVTPANDKAQNTQVTRSNIRKVTVSSVETDTKTERLIVHLQSPLKPNTDYILEISFDGNITDSLTGFYKSSYIDSNKETKVLAVTQFEPTSARAAFPCFDEPQFKATFEISIAHPNSYTALSNMPVSSMEPMADINGWTWSHFDRSVKMSTYLVAYSVAEFSYLETSYVSKNNMTKPIRVYTRPELKEQAKYALSIVPKLLTFYEDLFGAPYALPKMDLIAVPDFSSGAMENWGLITFRETGLLYDEKSAATRERQTVAIDVAHELAHQWFGNLVTMSWWTDLWLNEGFATYVEYVGVDHIEPEWRMLDKFTHDKMELLRSDALRHTTAVSMAVTDASGIAQKFDEIAYSKGASLVRMLNHTITERLFRKGLVSYLDKWKFSNAQEDDLWASMSAAAAEAATGSLQGVSVVKFMDTWTHQAGYPVVTARRDNVTGDVTFTQTLFTTIPSSRPQPTWSIPISYATINTIPTTSVTPNANITPNANVTPNTNVTPTVWETAPKLWLNEREKTVNVPLSRDQALYVNVDCIGYYRVNYDTQNWELLTRTLDTNTKALPPLARAQLLDDAFNLAKVSQLPYRVAMDLSVYLTKEDSRTVWDMALSNLGFIKYTLRSTQYYSDFQDYILHLLEPILKKYNYGLDAPRNDDEALLVESLLSWECACGGQRCILWAQKLFAEWMKKADYYDNPIPSNLRSVVYTEALRYGGRAEFDFLWRLFRNSTDPSVQALAISVLPSTRDESLIRLLLERSLTDIPPQHVGSAWNVDSPTAARLAQNFFIDHWLRIYSKFSKMDSFVIAAVVNGAFNSIMSEEDLSKFKKFVEDHYEELKPNRQSILKMADTATLRISWINSHAAAMGQWLKQFKAKLANNGTAAIDPREVTSNVTDVPVSSGTNTAQPSSPSSAANTTNQNITIT